MNPPFFSIPAGSDVAVLRLFGDPKRRPEPETIRVYFPGGEVDIVRCSDGDYWVHVALTSPERSGDMTTEPGFFRDARLDSKTKSASEADLGDFDRPDLYHVAMRVGRARPDLDLRAGGFENVRDAKPERKGKR